MIDIQSYLPHRRPFLFIDHVLEIIPSKKIVAVKKVGSNEPFFEGHFPHQAIMPGVLILEAMAQAVSILGSYSSKVMTGSNVVYILASIDRAVFKKKVLPEDELSICAYAQWSRSKFLCCDVTASVTDQMVCKARIVGARQEISNRR